MEAELGLEDEEVAVIRDDDDSLLLWLVVLFVFYWSFRHHQRISGLLEVRWTCCDGGSQERFFGKCLQTGHCCVLRWKERLLTAGETAQGCERQARQLPLLETKESSEVAAFLIPYQRRDNTRNGRRDQTVVKTKKADSTAQ